MNLPAILSDDDDEIEKAAEFVAKYYSRHEDGSPRWTGSRFNSWGGGGDSPDAKNRLTADDLVAVSFLTAPVPARAVIGIMDTHADDISKLLQRIPVDLQLADAKRGDKSGVLDDKGPAHELWRLLVGKKNEKWGIGSTRASKIMARKRPKLIPIYDSVVGPALGLKNSNGQWKKWHSVLNDGSGLPQRLREIHRRSGISDPISDIRVMDIVLWMHGSQPPSSRIPQES